MKLSKEEILEKLKSEHEAPTEEGYISLLEDISDSMEDCTTELTETIEKLTAQVEELKQKYIDRFFTTEETEATEETEEGEETESPEEVEIDDLFEEVNE